MLISKLPGGRYEHKDRLRHQEVESQVATSVAESSRFWKRKNSSGPRPDSFPFE